MQLAYVVWEPATLYNDIVWLLNQDTCQLRYESWILTDPFAKQFQKQLALAILKFGKGWLRVAPATSEISSYYQNSAKYDPCFQTIFWFLMTMVRLSHYYHVWNLIEKQILRLSLSLMSLLFWKSFFRKDLKAFNLLPRFNFSYTPQYYSVNFLRYR